MFVINAKNVNHALAQGINLMTTSGEQIVSRNGDTLEVPCPVTTVFEKPWERVLIDRTRDANPFFHLMEALWILQGRDDVHFLTEFNKRMADYSDDGITFNAPYGYRIREHFNDANNCDNDQLIDVIDILRKDPMSRQAVMQIWDPQDLANMHTKDKACNMSAVFRIRRGKLCLTVYNRSNDMLWGAYGANVVQFTMLQEYVAATLGIPMGAYTAVSNTFHVYVGGPGGELWDKVQEGYDQIRDPYKQVAEVVPMLFGDMVDFNKDLELFFNLYDHVGGIRAISDETKWDSYYFNKLVLPMLSVWVVHKKHGAKAALEYTDKIKADDWRMACEDWLVNRVKL